jgi:ATP-binding cassette subfamily F protein uup
MPSAPASRTPLIQCDGLSKQFGERPLFEGVSLALAEGDRVGLVGPNGAGKSTLLRVLAGLEEPDTGVRAVRKGIRVGYLPQEPAFAAGAGVKSALFDALGDLGLDEAERHGRAALLLSEARAFVVASHDRLFLENVARRMLELDRANPGGLLAVEGRYSDLLERRDELRRNQAEYAETLANRARRELEWLRRGPKARTTKSKARIDGAERLFGELAELRARTAAAPAAGIDFVGTGRRTKRLLVAKGVGKSFGGRRVLAGVDLVLAPGSRLGVLGANGSGKSTLLALLAGALEPDEGTIERAPQLRVARFEQGRETLEGESTLRRALAPHGDAVVYQGR